MLPDVWYRCMVLGFDCYYLLNALNYPILIVDSKYLVG